MEKQNLSNEKLKCHTHLREFQKLGNIRKGYELQVWKLRGKKLQLWQH